MFDDEVFLKEGFSADSFVSEQRKSLTLEKLHDELEQYVAVLDNSLVNIINNDYSAFLKLSSMLVDIDALVAGLREPLNQLENKVEDVKKVVSEPLNKQQALLERLVKVQEKKKVIKLCLSAREILDKVEVQVNRIKNQSKAEDDRDARPAEDVNQEEDESHSREKTDEGKGDDGVEAFGDTVGEALGLATQRLGRVSFLSQENQSLPLLRSIRAKARSLEHSLLEELDKAFVQVLTGRCSKLLGQSSRAKSIAVVLRAYVAINKRDQPNIVFKSRVVKPFLKDLFLQGNVDMGGPRGGAEGLANAYKQVLEFVNVKCRPLLEASRGSSEGLQNVDFVGNSVVEGLHEMIQEQLSFVYSSGNADTLHKTYKKTSALFNVLRSLSINPKDVDVVKAKTLDLWNLSVYTQLRSQEMFKLVEDSMATQVTDSHSLIPQGEGFRLEASQALAKCVDNCWRQQGGTVYLDRVGARLFRLTLELLGRYIGWCAGSVLFSAQSFGVELASESMSKYLAEGSTSDSLAEKAWGSNPACSSLLLLAADCNAMRNNLERWAYHIQGCLFVSNVNSAHVENGRQAVNRSLVQACGAALEEVQRGAEAVVEAHLTNRGTDILLEGLKGVAPMYKMTNIPAPTEASSYASSVLKPLQAFLEDGRSSLLSKDRLGEFCSCVVRSMLESFQTTAKKVLDEIVSSENTLRRLKRNASMRQMGSDKIRIQFRLDLECIATSASAIGIPIEDEPAFKSMQDLFATAET